MDAKAPAMICTRTRENTVLDIHGNRWGDPTGEQTTTSSWLLQRTGVVPRIVRSMNFVRKPPGDRPLLAGREAKTGPFRAISMSKTYRNVEQEQSIPRASAGGNTARHPAGPAGAGCSSFAGRRINDNIIILATSRPSWAQLGPGPTSACSGARCWPLRGQGRALGARRAGPDQLEKRVCSNVPPRSAADGHGDHHGSSVVLLVPSVRCRVQPKRGQVSFRRSPLLACGHRGFTEVAWSHVIHPPDHAAFAILPSRAFVAPSETWRHGIRLHRR